MLTVITPAPVRALTTVERAVAEAIPGMGDLSSRMVATLIDRATAAIETYIGRQLTRERVRESVTGDAARIWLTRRPVVELHEVAVDGAILVAGTWSQPDTGSIAIPIYRNWAADALDDWTEWTRYPSGLHRERARAWRKVEVEYTAGYVVHGWPDDERPTLPADIEWCCMELVRMQVEQRTRPAGVRSERLGDAAWTYGEPGKAAIPEDIMARLGPYRAAVI